MDTRIYKQSARVNVLIQDTINNSPHQLPKALNKNNNTFHTLAAKQQLLH